MERISLSYNWTLVFVAIATLYTTQAKLVDLTHEHDKDTVMSTIDMPRYSTQPLWDGELLPGLYAKWSKYALSEHGGTHVDAPNHFSKGGYSLAQIPLENTIADGVMIDCTEEAEDPNYLVPLQKIKDWEEAHGEIPQRAAVVFNFNWSRKFTNSTLYFSTSSNDSMQFRFPTVSEEAIDFLVDERDINILATDTMSSDLINTRFPVHVKMLTRNKMLAENIKDAGLLPPRGFRFHASPMKFVGGTGVQTRIYAIVHEDCDAGNGNVLGCSFLLVVLSTIGYLFA